MSESQAKPWVDGLTFGEVLSRSAARNPDRDAVVFVDLDQRWSYVQLADEVQAVARSLISLGIQPGDHVGIWATNWPQWVFAQFATGQMGAVLVNVNPAYRPKELAYILKQADLRALILTDRYKTSDYEEMLAQVVPELRSIRPGDPIASQDFPLLRHAISIKSNPSLRGLWSWSEFIARADLVSADQVDYLRVRRSIRPDMPVNIQFTSGTTGDPKGAMLSHRNLLMNAYYVGQRLGYGSDDKLCIPVPLYHCFGCVMGSLMCAVYGATMVFPSEQFEPEKALVAVDRERCTGIYGVPTMFNAEVHHESFDRYDVSSLRTGVMAGSPCPVELMKLVTTKMHCHQMTIGYGLTEASPIITQTDVSESIDVRVRTVGKELPGVEVRLVDPVTGITCSSGEQGELWARGHGVMIGYYNKPEATAAAITADGWLRSGDLATQTETGHYKITGRIKDMIIRGGENVYPREIEEFLLTHPAIRGVQIVGVPDTKFGEQISAWIVPQEPGSLETEELLQFCRDNLAHYKVPKYVEIVDQYPLTVTGKVQKFKLRELAIERYQLNQAAQEETA
ncbi:AMP-binding protein [bacterium]|nr:AMP-binding protein [bacterium]